MRKGLYGMATLSLAVLVLGGCGETEAPTVVEASAAEAPATGPLKPTKFATVTEMIDDKADFSEENGTFKVLSSEPLHIQLAAQVVANDLDEVKLAEVRRVALYGVYRTLIHTDAPSVHVSALPMEVTFNPYSARYLDAPKVEINVTRDDALQAVAGLIDVSSLEDLVTPNADMGIQFDKWSKPFEALYFKPEGQQALVNALQSK